MRTGGAPYSGLELGGSGRIQHRTGTEPLSDALVPMDFGPQAF